MICIYENIESRIIEIRDQKVLLDADVANLYGVETKRINEAIKNNPNKFPVGYILELSIEELNSLRSKFSTLEKSGKGQHSKYPPKVFTEKGLYMLATILNSQVATQTTISIIETFSRVRELSKAISSLSKNPIKAKQQSLMRKSGELITELLDNDLEISESETTIEINFAVLKFKHTHKKK